MYVDEYRVGSCTTDTAEVVRPSAMGGWTGFDSNTASGGATTAYGGSIGTGAWALDIGAGTGPGIGGKSWLYTDDLTGLHLAEITELGYATYVDSWSTAAAPRPGAQHPGRPRRRRAARHDAGVGSGLHRAGTGDEGHLAGVGLTRRRLVAHRQLRDACRITRRLRPPRLLHRPVPETTIVRWGATPGTAVFSGQSSGGTWTGFVGAVDGFTYGVANGDLTTVDFEAEAPPVNVELPSITGIGVDKILTADPGTWTGAAPDHLYLPVAALLVKALLVKARSDRLVYNAHVRDRGLWWVSCSEQTAGGGS